MKTLIENWGVIDYQEAWDKQTDLFNRLVDNKINNKDYVNTIVLCEHPHVYTLGKSGKDKNMLLSEEQLQRIGAKLFHINRGGDITYHGPGQIVCYPIINLEEFGLGIRDYIYLIEEAVILTCRKYGVECERLEGATGVWIDANKPSARKICAIGVRFGKYVTMHGLAFNINTDLTYFSYINPCGFIDKGVTSLSKEIGKEVDLREVERILVDNILNLLKNE